MRDILIFTVHRAGSMFLHGLTEFVARRIGVPHYSVNAQNFPDPRILQNDVSHFRGKHGCFGPIRMYCPVENLQNYNILLHLRDPRDVLVSHFYSSSYSHPGPYDGKKLPKSVREGLIRDGVDSYVLTQAPIFLDRYRTYCWELLRRNNVRLLRYEDMVLDFDRWLDGYLSAFEGAADGIFDAALCAEVRSGFEVPQEDVHAHRRKVTPGDHRDKLRPETISELNRLYAEVLKTLNYAP